MTEQRHDETKLLSNIQKDLDKFHDELDVDTLRQLQLVRDNALKQKRRSPWLLPSLTTAMAGVIALVFVLQFVSPNIVETTTFDDISLLSSSDELELYEDIEFLYWLELEGHRS